MRKFIAGIIIAASTCISAPANAAESMLTSWYGSYFHGRTTANGEVFNMYGYTAASPYLPFNTKLLVCYDGCAVVRINDRGPFVGGRQLDLSYAAAEDIGLTFPGVDYTWVSHI